jgi:carbonic anhydrase/acetyltransferase-like protein (isoleucine patch superfamily)
VTIRGDNNTITLGENVNIQDGAVLLRISRDRDR